MVEAIGQAYSFYFSEQAGSWQSLLADVDGTLLSTDVAGGFTGSMMGLYASGQGTASNNHADFDYFEYTSIEG
ncbi:hypothetical protein D3C87_2128510 [compost metagenome]